jgi:hypothetical protein
VLPGSSSQRQPAGSHSIVFATPLSARAGTKKIWKRKKPVAAAQPVEIFQCRCSAVNSGWRDGATALPPPASRAPLFKTGDRWQA